MMNMPRNLRLVTMAAVLVLAGCASKPKPAAEAPPPAPPPSSAVQGQVESTVVPGSVQDFRVNVGDTVHFDYDRYAITSEGRDLLQRQAAWLQKYQQVRVTIEGHCDERGTEEYNRSLGERRALALRETLVQLGVEPLRIDTTSFGKDRPVANGHNEAAWRQNRRGEFLLERPPTNPR